MMSAVATALEMRDIRKSFGPVKVLDGVDLVLRRGEVMGLIGENGAGKSTLMKILCGVHGKDGGSILLDGKPVEMTSVAHAQNLGISVIYQELSLIPDLNAVQNIFLNRELSFCGDGLASPLRTATMRDAAKRVLEDDLRSFIDLDTPLRKLPLAHKQMVEIARTVHADAKIIIMDEPTAALEAQEREQLFEVIRRLRDKGRSIIYISHHLDEILEICDSVTVLRDGGKVAEGPVSTFSVDDLIAKMVGKSLESQYSRISAEKGETLLTVEGLSRKGAFRDISFNLRQGEAIGIVGLEGCGKNEVIRALFGSIPHDSGTIRVRGKDRAIADVREAMELGLAFVPGERKTEGLFLLQDVAWNMTVASLNQLLVAGTIMRGKERRMTSEFIRELGAKAEGPDQLITHLSGGNQQKIMLARWIMTGADIFLLEEPTRGIDVNAKAEVYRVIGECLKRKKAAIIVSSEEEEVFNICDRILVMKNGELTAIMAAENANPHSVKQHAMKSGEGARQ